LTEDEKAKHVLKYYTDEELAEPYVWDGEYPPLRMIRIQQIRVGDLYVSDYRQLRNRDVLKRDYYLVTRLVSPPFLDRETKTYEMDTLNITDQKVQRHLYDNESAFRWFLVSRL
jgi:hypothetical protein